MGYFFAGSWPMRSQRLPNITGAHQCSKLSSRTEQEDPVSEDNTYLDHRTWRTQFNTHWRLNPY